jgi:hypothetical protein
MTTTYGTFDLKIIKPAGFEPVSRDYLNSFERTGDALKAKADKVAHTSTNLFSTIRAKFKGVTQIPEKK